MSAFLNWWQYLPYRIDPIAIHILGFPIRYYSLTYIISFLVGYWLLLYRIKNESRFQNYSEHLQDLMLFIMIGIFFGGRFGYVIFYNLHYYILNPWEIILPISVSENEINFIGFAGMSYHGGLIGSIIATLFFTNFKKINFLKTTDLVIPVAPLGYTLGRLGNFINGELYGRPTELSFGMYFPDTRLHILRHPSQLYEAFFEGLVIFIFLWIIRRTPSMKKIMLGLYLILYGLFRFMIEYLRQPDLHLGFIFYSISMGQILCGLMMFLGLFLIIYVKASVKNKTLT